MCIVNAWCHDGPILYIVLIYVVCDAKILYVSWLKSDSRNTHLTTLYSLRWASKVSADFVGTSFSFQITAEKGSHCTKFYFCWHDVTGWCYRKGGTVVRTWWTTKVGKKKRIEKSSLCNIVHNPRTSPGVGIVSLIPVSKSSPLRDPWNSGERSTKLSTVFLSFRAIFEER